MKRVALISVVAVSLLSCSDSQDQPADQGPGVESGLQNDGPTGI